MDSTPQRQREGATFRLTSREKQSTEGAGQGRRGVSLKERKREGEGVTLKNREGESRQLGPGGRLSHRGAPRAKGQGVRLPSASMEERRAAAHSAATAEHSTVFISDLSAHNNMNESAAVGGKKGKKEGHQSHGLEARVGVFMKHKKDEPWISLCSLIPSPHPRDQVKTSRLESRPEL